MVWQIIPRSCPFLCVDCFDACSFERPHPKKRMNQPSRQTTNAANCRWFDNNRLRALPGIAERGRGSTASKAGALQPLQNLGNYETMDRINASFAFAILVNLALCRSISSYIKRKHGTPGTSAQRWRGSTHCKAGAKWVCSYATVISSSVEVLGILWATLDICLTAPFITALSSGWRHWRGSTKSGGNCENGATWSFWLNWAYHGYFNFGESLEDGKTGTSGGHKV